MSALPTLVSLGYKISIPNEVKCVLLIMLFVGLVFLIPRLIRFFLSF